MGVKENNEIKLKVLAKEWETIVDHIFMCDSLVLKYIPNASISPIEPLGYPALLQ